MTKYKTLVIYVIIATIIVMGFFGYCTRLNKSLGLKNDNLIEQAIEGLIEVETGLSVDLTP